MIVSAKITLTLCLLTYSLFPIICKGATLPEPSQILENLGGKIQFQERKNFISQIIQSSDETTVVTAGGGFFGGAFTIRAWSKKSRTTLWKFETPMQVKLVDFVSNDHFLLYSYPYDLKGKAALQIYNVESGDLAKTFDCPICEPLALNEKRDLFLANLKVKSKTAFLSVNLKTGKSSFSETLNQQILKKQPTWEKITDTNDRTHALGKKNPQVFRLQDPDSTEKWIRFSRFPNSKATLFNSRKLISQQQFELTGKEFDIQFFSPFAKLSKENTENNRWIIKDPSEPIALKTGNSLSLDLETKGSMTGDWLEVSKIKKGNKSFILVALFRGIDTQWSCQTEKISSNTRIDHPLPDANIETWRVSKKNGSYFYAIVFERNYILSHFFLVDLERKSAGIISSYPGEGWIKLHLSPQDEIFYTTSPTKDSDSEDHSTQAFAQISFSLGGGCSRSDWPQKNRYQYLNSLKIVDKRYLIWRSALDAIGENPTNIGCFDLQELRPLWRITAENWMNGDIYSDGANLIFSWDNPTQKSRFIKSQRRMSLDLLSGEATLLPNETKWNLYTEQDDASLLMEKLNLEFVILENNEWILFSRNDGVFAGSDGAAPLIGLTIGKSSYPIDQFGAFFNRPDLLLERLNLTSSPFYGMLKNAVTNRWRKLSHLDYTAHEPPYGAIKLIDKNNSIAKIHIEGKAFGVKKITSYRIISNGVPLIQETLSKRKLIEEHTIHLEPGKNTIEFEVTDSSGITGIRDMLVLTGDTIKPKRLFFIGLGVSSYEDNSFQDLLYAHKDAEDLANAFKKLPGFTQKTIKVFKNTEINSALFPKLDNLISESQPNDFFVLFISGHGIYKGENYYFLPSQTDSKKIEETAINYSEFEKLISRSKSRNKILLIDTCESGERPKEHEEVNLATISTNDTLAKRGYRARTTNGLVAVTRSSNRLGKNRFLFSDLRRNEGAIVFSSCGWNEASLEPRDGNIEGYTQNGLFTQAVLEMLEQGLGDSNQDQKLTKFEMRDFLSKRVANLSTGLQNPTLDRDNRHKNELFHLPSSSEKKPNNFYPISVNWHENLSEIWLPGFSASAQVEATKENEIFVNDNGEKTIFRGHYTDGFLNGKVTKIGSSKCSVEFWSSGQRVGIIDEYPLVTLTQPGDGPGYVETTDGIYVWNNKPMPDETVTWDGDEAGGFATGEGTITWFKNYKFMVSYQGTMKQGKLHGVTKSQDSKGRIGIRTWKNGVKIK